MEEDLLKELKVQDGKQTNSLPSSSSSITMTLLPLPSPLLLRVENFSVGPQPFALPSPFSSTG